MYTRVCVYAYIKTAKFIPNLLGLAVAERKKTLVIQNEWRQAKHLAALHEVPKEPYIQSIETYMLSKEPYTLLNERKKTQVSLYRMAPSQTLSSTA